MATPRSSSRTSVNDTFERANRNVRALGLLVAASALILAACAAPSPTRVPPTPTALATAALARPLSTATAEAVSLRSSDLLNALFYYGSSGGAFFDAVNVQAVRLAGSQGDRGLIAPLIDVLRFSFTEEASEAVASSLRQLTGENLGSDFDPWYEWLGRQTDLPVVAGYDRWKGEMLSGIDPGFVRFFHKDVPTRVPLWGAVWGGVGIDGIPPLDDPPFVSAAEAGYLQDDDVVLGVEINGDVRAYPHRILAWHEMSNDVVGGRPVTLVY